MIQEIILSSLNGSFQEKNVLELKQYNLIYGINGTGKTTISRLLNNWDCNITDITAWNKNSANTYRGCNIKVEKTTNNIGYNVLDKIQVSGIHEIILGQDNINIDEHKKAVKSEINSLCDNLKRRVYDLTDVNIENVDHKSFNEIKNQLENLRTAYKDKYSEKTKEVNREYKESIEFYNNLASRNDSNSFCNYILNKKCELESVISRSFTKDELQIFSGKGINSNNVDIYKKEPIYNRLLTVLSADGDCYIGKIITSINNLSGLNIQFHADDFEKIKDSWTTAEKMLSDNLTGSNNIEYDECPKLTHYKFDISSIEIPSPNSVLVKSFCKNNIQNEFDLYWQTFEKHKQILELLRDAKHHIEQTKQCLLCKQDISAIITQIFGFLNDQEYEDNLRLVQSELDRYINYKKDVNSELDKLTQHLDEHHKSYIETIAVDDNDIQECKNLIQIFSAKINNNIENIEKKILDNTIIINNLEKTAEYYTKINKIIDEKINKKIDTYKQEYRSIQSHREQMLRLQELRVRYLAYYLWQYYANKNKDKVNSYEKYKECMTSLEQEQSSVEKEIDDCIKRIELIYENIDNIRNVQQSKKLADPEQFINKILSSLSIDIKLVENNNTNNFHIIRSSNDQNCDTSQLSEGERQMFAFLYFLFALKCDYNNDRNVNFIIVIDDPICSMSHFYKYDIAQLIKTEIKNEIPTSQIILLTHDIYFFREIEKTLFKNDKNNKKSTEVTKYYLSKSDNTSTINHMPNIRNQYEECWYIIATYQHHTELRWTVPNAMRKIIEELDALLGEGSIKKIIDDSENELTNISKDGYAAFKRFCDFGSHNDVHVFLSEPNYGIHEHYIKVFEYIFTHVLDKKTEPFSKYYNTMIAQVTGDRKWK